jgi:multidrug efflux pump subunit AcrB
MPGIPGKFFREFGWTAATAVLFSLLVARLLTPMMAAYQLKAHPEKLGDTRLMTWYLKWVDRCLRHRWWTLIIATVLFLLSMLIPLFIPATFIPSSDLGRSNLVLELPPGTRLQDTVQLAELARRKLASIPELKHVYSTIGGTVDIGDPTKSGVMRVRAWPTCPARKSAT